MDNLQKELLKVYSILSLIPVYCTIAPLMWTYSYIYGLVFLIFPGLYFYTYMAFVIHESHHRYFKGHPNNLIFRIALMYAYGDPQVYSIVHPLHHKYVHTDKDLEINPLGKIKSKKLRIISRLLELTFGLIYVQIIIIYKIITNPELNKRFSLFNMFFNFSLSTLFYFLVGYISFSLGADIQSILLCYISTIWSALILIRIVQLVEHGDIFTEENDPYSRNLLTRNMSKDSFFERLFHFYTHNDSYNHTMHHLNASKFNRILPNNNTDSYNYIRLGNFQNILSLLKRGKNNE